MQIGNQKRSCLFDPKSSENSPSGYFMDMSESSDKQFYHSGQKFVCPQCGWQIPEDLIAVSAMDSATRHSSNDAATLDALFGDSSPSDSKPIFSDTDTKRFCKNCRHYLQTPFISRCLLHNHEVEPLGLCEHFSLPHNA